MSRRVAWCRLHLPERPTPTQSRAADRRPAPSVNCHRPSVLPVGQRLRPSVISLRDCAGRLLSARLVARSEHPVRATSSFCSFLEAEIESADSADFQAFAKDMAFPELVSRCPAEKIAQVLQSASIRGHSHRRTEDYR
jgi:hypothetical protein